MEDFIIREIDRIGEMLMKIARKLGLLDGCAQDYTLADVKEEFGKASLPFDLESVIREDNPILYLVEKVELSNQGIEFFIDILFHSDLDDAVKEALLKDALAYLDSRGYYSFRLHSLVSK